MKTYHLYYRLPWSGAAVGQSCNNKYTVLRSDTEKVVAYCDSEEEAKAMCSNNEKPNLGQEILTLLREKADEDFEYYNPHFLSEIVDLIDQYYDLEDKVVNKWIYDMFSA